MKLIKDLKSNKTAFITAISVIVFVQVPHLMIVFSKLSELPENGALVHGSLYALSVDLGVLFFAVRGKTVQTVIFMVISALITVEYYINQMLDRLDQGNYLGTLIVVLIAITPSILIYFISEELKTKKYEKRQGSTKGPYKRGSLRGDKVVF